MNVMATVGALYFRATSPNLRHRLSGKTRQLVYARDLGPSEGHHTRRTTQREYRARSKRRRDT
ncbi:hypothetical protein SERLADRAFT_465557 [Serpula lacrymans var. lacrymans S7.9]|uniref:Uncharacterized protein n=1 Tax=Serpula lacrymans var. lacrymans (strain S7.9) TaxID=578457 RepID=F8NSU8_SERL9|nr:uncharacterized protein SERLADRAFT_465557 [Serpula lacrymans var. lacrymans S7.9]EGO25421.1 hypothetical protein SERLADRAFT_465557 [Serpula lacrymans var. lacrymans S7.9]